MPFLGRLKALALAELSANKIAGALAALLVMSQASAASFSFSTGDPDGKIATLSRPAGPGKLQTADQRSVGGEIFIDTKWWNQYPLTFGFRISHLLDRDQFDGFQGTVYEFVLPVSIIPR